MPQRVSLLVLRTWPPTDWTLSLHSHPHSSALQVCQADGLKRPPELVRAHSKVVEIHEAVTQESEFRQTYPCVFGGLEPTWSLAREKKLVRVLMDLTAAGILPFEELGVSEFVTPRPVCFRAIVTPSP